MQSTQAGNVPLPVQTSTQAGGGRGMVALGAWTSCITVQAPLSTQHHLYVQTLSLGATTNLLRELPDNLYTSVRTEQLSARTHVMPPTQDMPHRRPRARRRCEVGGKRKPTWRRTREPIQRTISGLLILASFPIRATCLCSSCSAGASWKMVCLKERGPCARSNVIELLF